MAGSRIRHQAITWSNGDTRGWHRSPMITKADLLGTGFSEMHEICRLYVTKPLFTV